MKEKANELSWYFNYVEGQEVAVDQKVNDILYALDQSAIVAITDRTGKIIYANEKFEKLSQYSTDELIGETHAILNSGKHPRAFFKEMWKTIGTGNVWRGEIRNVRKDGQYYWVDTTIVPFLNEKGIPYQYISIRNDITEKKEAEMRIRHLAYEDQLTNLPNRLSFRKSLEEIVEDAKTQNKELCLVKLNIDRFRFVNDSLGYENGDYVLSIIAERLKAFLPANTMIARLGGDEFAFILEGKKDREDWLKEAKKIQEEIQRPIYIAGQSCTVTMSAGISFFPEHATEHTELSKKAENALIEMKANGGGGYLIYQPNRESKTIERMFLENELRKSIKYGHFNLVYQPKYTLENQKLVGFEALVRWDHPDLGRIPPDQFIEIAEETHMIMDLGKWVLEEACRQSKVWQGEGFNFPIAVNVSAVQLANFSFIDQLSQVLKDYEMDPSLLELELTETAFANREELQDTLLEIQKMGVKIAIDDFGTGYSAFSYIKELPVDTLKIDRSFIQDLTEDVESAAIVQAILSVAKTVGLEVVSEGIEEEYQLNVLKELECEQGQGYYFSKPLDPEACYSILNDQVLDA